MTDKPKRAPRSRRPRTYPARSVAYQAKREELAILIASGMPYARAARELHVNKSTIHKWVREPELAARIDELMRSSVDRAKRRMLSAADRAVEAALEAMDKGDWRAGIAILDRVGLHPKQTIEHETPVDLSEESLDKLSARARELVGKIAQLKASKEGGAG